MFLVVPDSYVERMEIMSTICGSEKVEKPFKKANVTFLTPTKKEEKKEEVKTEPKKEEPKVEKKEEVKTDPKKEPEVTKEEVKAEPKVEEVKVEEQKTSEPEVTKEEVKVEEPKVEEVAPDAKLMPNTEEDKITMENNRICPVKIVPKKSVVSRINVKATDSHEEEIDESLESFKGMLMANQIRFSDVRRVETGLVEVDLITNNGIVLITVDINDKLYGLGTIVFFYGKIKPVDEYINQPIVFTENTIFSLINGTKIDPKYYVPKAIIEASSVLDIETLHEHDDNKKRIVLDKAFKSIEKMKPEIEKSLGNNRYRFVFTRYKSENDFTMISSSKNRVSSLSNDTLLTTNRQVRIDVKNDEVTINIK